MLKKKKKNFKSLITPKTLKKKSSNFIPSFLGNNLQSSCFKGRERILPEGNG